LLIVFKELLEYTLNAVGYLTLVVLEMTSNKKTTYTDIVPTIKTNSKLVNSCRFIVILSLQSQSQNLYVIKLSACLVKLSASVVNNS